MGGAGVDARPALGCLPLIRAVALLGALGGCAYRLGAADVRYGVAEPIPLVSPSTDARRWYIPLESERLGPRLLFVDTGYSYTTCDDDLVADLGLPTRGRVRVRGEVGQVEGTKAHLPPLVLGGHRVEGLTCQVRDLHTTSSLRDPEEVAIAGVVGMDILGAFRVVVDPGTAHLSLHEPDREAPLSWDDPLVTRLRRERGQPRVRVPVAFLEHAIWPILDSGSTDTYVRGERLGLEPTRRMEGVVVSGTGEGGDVVRTMTYYVVPSVVIGTTDVGGVTLTDRSRGSAESGLLGLDVLRRVRQEYDFPGRRARFETVEAQRPPRWDAWRDEGSPGAARLEDASPTE